MSAPRVIVIGGGVAGLTVAHELADRGFAVSIYEARRDFGGKARSQPVPGTGTNGRRDLPGEHGFRFYPRFYRHVTDQMARIPVGERTVADFLRPTTEAAFFDARRGRLHGFRFHDPLDWKSCAPSQAPSATDQPLGVGDGETTQFQLVKRYVSGGAFSERRILKPVEDTVLVAVDGVATTAFEVHWTTGVVTFDAAPAEGAVLTAGFAFDVPVRFDTDRLDMALAGHDAVRVVRAPVVEITG
jgi:uncharacterized protein (TIGR02217 family)